jgi:YVTN family beta-propeller protein
VAVAAAPAQTIVAPDGRRLYVAHHNPNQETQQISVIDAASMQVVGVIDSVGRAPHGVVIAADGTRLYTMNTLGDDIGVVDLATGRTLMRIPVSSNNPLIPGFIARYEPYGGLLTNNGTMLWVTCRRSGEVRVIDLAAGRVVDSIFVGVQPLAPALAADGHTLWVPNRVTNTISVLDTRTHSTIATIRDITTGPTCIGFSSDGATAYVACEKAGDSGGHGMAGSPGVLYVLDANTYNVRNSLELASGPIGMAILR